MSVGQASTVEYANLLRRHGSPETPEVVAYRDQHADDKVFLSRAAILDQIFENKEAIIALLKE